jgi:hypothetical protein
MSMERLFLKTLGLPKENLLVWGSTEAECHAFGREICTRRVDVALIDMFLEFDEGETLILGTQIAKQARALGFQGCLIAHTANDSHEDVEKMFHGIIGKTSDKERLVKEICQLWTAFRVPEHT